MARENKTLEGTVKISCRSQGFTFACAGKPASPRCYQHYFFVVNGLNRSIGIGKRVFELLCAPTSLKV